MIPKSQISYHSTSGKELKYKGTGKEYTGPYIKTKKGMMYAGTSNISLGAILIPIVPPSSKHSNFVYKDVRKFNIIRSNIKNFLGKTKPIVSTKSYPSTNEYIQGYFFRYFAKRINDPNYQEISKETHDSLMSREEKYDHNLYEAGKIKWHLIGNVFKQNSLSIKSIENRWKNISYLFPILNEFQQPASQTQENLYTEGGELYKPDGAEYKGEYHIHPTMGPMEGPIHTDVPHPKLYYLDQLPSPKDESYEDFLKTYPPPNVPTSTPSAVPVRGEGTLSSNESYNCMASWGIPPTGYTGFINSDGQAPLSTNCIDPGDGTGTYKHSDYGPNTFSTCRTACNGTEAFGIGCLLEFDPNYCSECSIHDRELCTGNYFHNIEEFNPEQDSGDYTCFCGDYEGLPYYSQVCC